MGPVRVNNKGNLVLRSMIGVDMLDKRSPDGSGDESWCRACSGTGYLCEIEDHNTTGCAPACQMTRLADRCGYCKGSGVSGAWASNMMKERCKHSRIAFSCDGYHINCLDCVAWWRPHALTLSQRIRCETGATGNRNEPGALVQLASVMLQEDNDAVRSKSKTLDS